MNKLLRNRLIARIVIVILVGIFAISALQVSLTVKNKGNAGVTKEEQNTLAAAPKKQNLQPGKASASDGEVNVKREPKKAIDISNVTVSSEIENIIKKKDSKNFDRNINNYKRLLKGLDVPDSYRKEIERLIKNGHSLPDIMTAYEFLYENYGLINEMEGLISNKESGKTWSEIFKDYDSIHKEFIPTDFKPGYLEGLMQDQSLTADDVMNADRISQKELAKFDELIAMRKEGKKWKDISGSLGVVNTAEKLPRISLTSAQVHKHMKDTGLTEKQVIDALVIANRTDKDDADVLAKVKEGSKKEDIYAESYKEKYN